MNVSDLTVHADLSRTWANLALDSFNAPDNNMARLWEMAERDSWIVSDMDWNTVDFSSIPWAFKKRIANMMTQLHYGEVTAMLCAARLVQQAPGLSAQLFSCAQVNDEARHVQWFSRFMQKLECDGKVQDSVMEFMNSVYTCDSVDGLIVGMHILVEGMAHSFFMEGSRMVEQAGLAVKVSSPYRSAKKVIGEWLPNYLGRDESRHIAYGVQYLRHRLPELSVKERDILENQVNEWGGLFARAALDPGLVVIPGMDGRQVADRCIRDLNLRLSNIGLIARIPAVETISADDDIWTTAELG